MKNQVLSPKNGGWHLSSLLWLFLLGNSQIIFEKLSRTLYFKLFLGKYGYFAKSVYFKKSGCCPKILDYTLNIQIGTKNLLPNYKKIAANKLLMFIAILVKKNSMASVMQNRQIVLRSLCSSQSEVREKKNAEIFV